MTSDVTVQSPRFLSVIFADDIRQEVDGKITIVGVYQSKMLFPQLPAVIPKLAVVMTAVTPVAQPFEKLVFSLYKNDEQIQQFEIEKDALTQAAGGILDSPVNGVPMIEFHFATVLGLLGIDEPCVLRTRLETESGILAGRSLQVNSAASAPEAVSEKV